MKTVIFSKSCSRCGGSLVFKGQTLQKSVPRATPNDNGARKRKKSVPAPSPDALFRPRARFWSILGLRPGPKMSPKVAISQRMRSTFGVIFVEVALRACLETFWDCSGRLRGCSGDPPGGFLEAFWKIFLEKIRCKNNGKNRVENFERRPGKTHNRKKTSAKPLQNSSKYSGQPLPQ